MHSSHLPILSPRRFLTPKTLGGQLTPAIITVVFRDETVLETSIVKLVPERLRIGANGPAIQRSPFRTPRAAKPDAQGVLDGRHSLLLHGIDWNLLERADFLPVCAFIPFFFFANDRLLLLVSTALQGLLAGKGPGRKYSLSELA